MNDLDICSKCKHERKYHKTIHFAFSTQTGCHIIDCKCKKFAKLKIRCFFEDGKVING